jgi:16S rRNA (guanine966-N2)-methyltransferase
MRVNRVVQKSNQVRIIGGSQRGRKISFPDLPGLRPSGDRVRETLFNWLQPHLSGADCLDLFAGSGVLGFEAASRGAARVVLIEQAATAVQQLQQSSKMLGLEQVRIEQADSLQWLQGVAQPFDIVFLDPPFADDLLSECCLLLEQGGWLQPQARIYLEIDAADELPNLPDNWRLLREKKAGQVAFFLYTCDG